MSELQIIITAVVILIVYKWVAYRLSCSIQPLRLEVAERGEWLLSEPDIPEVTKDGLKIVMGWVFSARGAWFVSLAFVAVLVSTPFLSRPQPEIEVPADLEEDYSEVLKRALVCILANSPLALTLFVLVGFLAMIFIRFDRLIRVGISAPLKALEGRGWLLAWS